MGSYGWYGCFRASLLLGFYREIWFFPDKNEFLFWETRFYVAEQNWSCNYGRAKIPRWLLWLHESRDFLESSNNYWAHLLKASSCQNNKTLVYYYSSFGPLLMLISTVVAHCTVNLGRKRWKRRPWSTWSYRPWRLCRLVWTSTCRMQVWTGTSRPRPIPY